MFNFSVLKSKTWWGIVSAALSFVFSPVVLDKLPANVAAIAGTVGTVLAVLGLRDAVAVGPTVK